MRVSRLPFSRESSAFSNTWCDTRDRSLPGPCCSAVWDYYFDPQTNVIDVQISRLRRKIEKGFSPQLLHTVRGIGYMIAADD